MVNLVRIDGLPVAAGTAFGFTRLKAAFDGQGFRDELGRLVTLHVFSGYRTYEEQKRIFLDRYVPVSMVAGRRVYDYRRWNGQLWARIDPGGTVAVPGTSNHGDGRALDIRDSGSDPGVTRYGNERSAWIRAHAHEFGFDPDGYRDLDEPWHIRFTGDQWNPPAAPANVDEDDMFTDDDRKKLDNLTKRVETLLAAQARIDDSVSFGKKGVRTDGHLVALVKKIANKIGVS